MARANNLTVEGRRRIAVSGGKARQEAIRNTRRIAETLAYSTYIETAMLGRREPVRVSVCERLPSPGR